MTTTRKARILIVDDHPLVRSGLRRLIEFEDDLEVAGEACDTSDALKMIEHVQPDVAVVDISLKNGSGIELIKQIKNRYPAVKVLVSSMHDESLYAERTLRAGALGYVNKEEPGNVMIDAIRQVLRGEIHLSSNMVDRVLHRVAHGEGQLQRPSIENLSDRELEVFEFIGRGLTTRQIAGKLHLSVKTVETHREHIKTKLNLKNSTELTRHAVRWILENN